MVVPYLFRRPLLAGVLLWALVLAVRRAAVGPPRPAAGDASLAAGSGVALRGKIVSPPDRRAYGVSCVIEATAIREAGEGDFSPASGRVAATIPGRPPVDWGDEAVFWGKLTAPRGPAAPGAYDERKVLESRGIFCRLAARPRGARILKPLPRTSPLWWVTQTRRRFLHAFQRLSPPSRAISAGLFLGEKPAGFSALQEDFRKSGTIHLLITAGIHVAFVLSLWWLAGRWIFLLPRRAVLGFSVPLAFFYAFLAGARTPVMRAATMAAVGVTGLLLGRVDRPVHLIGFSALVLLILDPGALFQAGFQMSFAAVLGLALGMPAVEAGLRRLGSTEFWPPRGRRRRLADGAVRLFAVSFLVQSALAPHMIFYFHRLPWVAPFANLAAVPWAELCLALGAVLFLADLARLPGTNLAAAATDKADIVLWKIAAWWARMPGTEAALYWNGRQVAALAAAVAGTFLLLSFIRPTGDEEEEMPAVWGRGKTWTLAGLWTAAVAAILLLKSPEAKEPTLLWPRAAADIVVSVSEGGIATVVNPGSAADVRLALEPFLRRHGARVGHVIFTRARKNQAETFAEIAKISPDAEALCAAPRADCADLAGASWEDGGVIWRAEQSGAGRAARKSGRAVQGGTIMLSAAVRGRKFLFASGRGGPFPAGPWEAVSIHPLGRKPPNVVEGVEARRWVLWGRSGESWDRALGKTTVRRPSRDGFLLWRAEGGWGER